jgi:tRNA A-37 threonylcarbamoyl transferase component Bud32
MPPAPTGAPGPAPRPSPKPARPSASAAPATATSSDYSGRTIARCTIAERLGRGATSHVFRAYSESLGGDVAIKILPKELRGSDEGRIRFLAEARAIARLDHENVVKVFDVVEDQGLFCILMELIDGPTLQDRLDDEGVLPPLHALKIAAQMARALEAAHAERIVHRDLKPSNVLVAGPPGDESAKVVDFGLAIPQEVNRVGTPLYMSPEAAQGKRIDDKSDVYALGVCLYVMLTGTHPFGGENVKEILAAHVNDELVPPSRKRPQLGELFDEALKKLLVKSKGYRPTAAEAAQLLEGLTDSLLTQQKGTHERRRKLRRHAASRKSGAGLWVGAAVLAIAIGGVVYAVMGGSSESSAPAATAGPTRAELAKRAWDETSRWVAANASKLEESQTRWATLAKQFGDTEWGGRAAIESQRLDGEIRKKIESEVDAKKKTAAAIDQAGSSKDPRILVGRFEDAVRRFAWADAAARFDEIPEPPMGTSVGGWDQRGERVRLLAREFTNKADAAFHSKKVKAKDVFADAKDNETLVGANSSGVQVSDGRNERTVEWNKAKAEAFLARGAIGRAVDSMDVDSNLVMAALARELGLPSKAVADWQDNARIIPGVDSDSLNGKIRSLFGGGGDDE